MNHSSYDNVAFCLWQRSAYNREPYTEPATILCPNRLAAKIPKQAGQNQISDFFMVTPALPQYTASKVSTSTIKRRPSHFFDHFDNGSTFLISYNERSLTRLERKCVTWAGKVLIGKNLPDALHNIFFYLAPLLHLQRSTSLLQPAQPPHQL